MDIKQRAQLVRELRVESKQRAGGVDPWEARDPDSSTMSRVGNNAVFRPRARNTRSRIEMARTRSRFQRVRSGETGDQYIGRTAEGGDSSYGAAAARYDLRRPRGAARVTPWEDGYTGYSGNPREHYRGRSGRPYANDRVRMLSGSNRFSEFNKRSKR